MSLDIVRRSFQNAIEQAGDDLVYTVLIAGATTILLLAVAVPLARASARRWAWIDRLSVVPIAVPAVLLSIGIVQVYNSGWVVDHVYPVTGDLYDSWLIVACAYAARFLPFGVLTMSQSLRRQSRALEDAAALSGRGPVARALRIHLPLLVPAAWSAACLIFVLALRELDVAVVLPSGNGTVVRRLSNVVHFGGEDVGGALALLLLLVAALFPLLTLILTGRKLRSLA
jgi:iron(III) transport system permease protein